MSGAIDMGLIIATCILVAIGMVLVLLGKEKLESGRGLWSECIVGILSMALGCGVLIYTFSYLLGI